MTRAVVWGTLATLAVLGLLLGVAQWLAHGALQGAPTLVNERHSPPTHLIPGPVSSRDIFTERAARAKAQAQEARLRAYGWVERSPHHVHIPIEVAMDIIAREYEVSP